MKIMKPYMKKSLLVLALCLCSLASWTQTFSAVAPTGQTLNYSITSTTDHTVEVVGSGGGNWNTGSMLIPCSVEHEGVIYSVTSIRSNAFMGNRNLTSVNIPNSVTSIGAEAFRMCGFLTSAAISSRVEHHDDIGPDIFVSCSSLGTIYWYYFAINPDDFKNQYMGGHTSCSRFVAKIHYYGSGDFVDGSGCNNIAKIEEPYAIDYATASGSQSVIPFAQLPTNFIGKVRNGSNWVAREIVLTDGQDNFSAPKTFTAGTATYTRNYTEGNRSTICLPFKPASVTPADDLKFYAFSGFDGSTITFSEVAFADLQANTPYMVEWPATKSNEDFVFTASDAVVPATGDAASRTVTKGDGSFVGKFVGTMARTCMNSNNYGYKDGFFVRSAGGSECDGHAHVNPFRAYFEIPSSSPSGANLHTISVRFATSDEVGIEAAETPEQGYDVRYGKDVYDMLGRLVRKNADNLEGLPRGVYIWKGKKFVNCE